MKKMVVVDAEAMEYIPNVDRIIREKECRQLTTLANSTRWNLEREGKFPKRVKIGASAVGYRFSEVQAWIKGEWK
ncbi:helix-turn-helix transcriptional regulator [Cedecea sp. S5-13]|uniref:helix-turn-helix transcriptional regulator n=1 Tax=Cedecea selenatireducens TaxID=3144416 RepID=UPI0035CD36A4